MTGVVVGIPRPAEAVVGNFVPFFTRDFTGFAADANAWIGKKSYFDAILHVRVFPLVRALDSFADHTFTFDSVNWVAIATSRPRDREIPVRHQSIRKACSGETPKPTRETRALPEEIRRSSIVDLSVFAVATGLGAARCAGRRLLGMQIRRATPRHVSIEPVFERRPAR